MSHHAVMTMNRRIWDEYGHRAVATFLALWDSAITLHLYAEDFVPDAAPGEHSARLVVHSMPAWHEHWKARHVHNRDAHGLAGPRLPYDYHRDCVRFSHKVAALTDIADQIRAGVLIMLDADVITHEAVDQAWLDGLFPAGPALAWLERENHYPECGFVMFRADHPAFRPFMAQLRGDYTTDRVFQMRETHDSFVIQQLVHGMVRAGEMPRPHNLSAGRGRQNRSHPFVVSRLGERMDHLKGARKDAGRTDPAEAKRRGGYWTS